MALKGQEYGFSVIRIPVLHLFSVKQVANGNVTALTIINGRDDLVAYDQVSYESKLGVCFTFIDSVVSVACQV